LTEFKGTTAMAITWDGFDGYANPANGGNNYSLDFQVILRVDGRITIFYKIPNGGASVWENVLDNNGWIVGLSGGRAAPCTDDSECDAAFGTTGLFCDTGDATTVSGQVVWQPEDRCTNLVDFNAAGSVPVGGIWQGE
jgi:hypothetical protein